MGWNLDEVPQIALTFASNELSCKIAQAVQQQWKEALGIDVVLDSCEAKLLRPPQRG